MLFEQSPNSRTCLGNPGGLLGLRSLGFGLGRHFPLFSCCDLTLFENGQHLAGRHGRTVLDLYLPQHSRCGRRHLEYHFVGFEVDEILVARHRIAGLLVPADERRVADRFRQWRHLDLNTHLGFRFVSLGLADLLALLSISSAASTKACCC